MHRHCRIPAPDSRRAATAPTRRCWALLLVGLLFAGPGVAQNAQTLFSANQEQIFQIRLLERSSGSKAGIGSGFQVAADGLLATNYHVIAEAVRHPDRYRIEFIDAQGVAGELELVDIDVVHDLALVRHGDKTRTRALTLSAQPMRQGDEVFSMGNPLDLGMTVISGIYNGLLENSLYQRLLFSGSLNPGMSGGPALDSRGEVIGINVATQGNQISFLVPASHLKQLLDGVQAGAEPEADPRFKQRIEEQLVANQALLIDSLLAQPWPLNPLGKARVSGEMARYTRCWGNSNDSDLKARYREYSSTCRTNDQIYLQSDFNTGQFGYGFSWVESDELNTWQLYSRYATHLSGLSPNNNARKDQVGRLQCHGDFVAIGSLEVRHWKTVLCARQYQHYPALFDVLFAAANNDDAHQGLVTYFQLAGVTQANALKFAKHFMEHVQWASL
ncbi:MAG: serine protease [Pseudomonadota bacterium]